MDAKECKQFRKDYQNALAWYERWKKKYQITPKDSGPERAGKILARTYSSCLVEAYTIYESYCEEDPNLDPEDSHFRKQMIYTIANNLAEERGVEIPEFAKNY